MLANNHAHMERIALAREATPGMVRHYSAVHHAMKAVAATLNVGDEIVELLAQKWSAEIDSSADAEQNALIASAMGAVFGCDAPVDREDAVSLLKGYLNDQGMVGVKFFPITVDEAAQLADGAPSAVGHESTAAVFSSQLGVEVPFNRVNAALQRGNVALVGQYRGPRLAEGATELPEGATIQWLRVEVQ